ncbi:energy transducer TonB [Brenneria tiliae]|uniref:energy transducer TonB n=1 Tax=Brenneria tiliae TaxID=2914984 RepID=UPI002014FA86|nr:energy transducer TonB [Brenneria tiliae]MCL2899176.1 energy transducer TonB [Brenneria tiliae]MCL2903554.1 energy transducer TonB [Brenneria tiliae]
MKHFSSTSIIGGKGEKILTVLLAAALHALAIYLLISSPLSTPAIPQAAPRVTLELALAAAAESTPNAAETPATKTAPAPVEEPPSQDSPPAADSPATAQPEPVAPPKPPEKRPEPRRTAKARPQPASQRTPSPPADAPSAGASAAETSSKPATAAAPTGTLTPASASAAHLNNPAPRYPAMALKRKWQGTVTLRVRVLANGKPGEIQIVNSSRYDMLDRAAIDAVRQWTFVPAQRDGAPQDSWASFPLSFKLQ